MKKGAIGSRVWMIHNKRMWNIRTAFLNGRVSGKTTMLKRNAEIKRFKNAVKRSK